MNLELNGSSIELTPEQIEELEKLAGCNYSAEDIAIYFGFNKKAFVAAFNAPDSEIKEHYDRGRLLVQAMANTSFYDSAKAGNITAYQQLTNAANYNKLENAVKKSLMQKEKQSFAELQEFVQKKHKGEMPAELAIYYEQLDTVRSLWHKQHTKEFIINVLLSSYSDITYYRAKKLFDEAMNFFYLDSEVQYATWCNVYAEKCDIIASIAFEMRDFKIHEKYMARAMEFRKEAELYKPKPKENETKYINIYTVEPEQLGLPKADRKRLKDHINGLSDIDSNQRDRLHLEAQDGEGKGNIMGGDLSKINYLQNESEESED